MAKGALSVYGGIASAFIATITDIVCVSTRRWSEDSFRQSADCTVTLHIGLFTHHLVSCDLLRVDSDVDTPVRNSDILWSQRFYCISVDTVQLYTMQLKLMCFEIGISEDDIQATFDLYSEKVLGMPHKACGRCVKTWGLRGHISGWVTVQNTIKKMLVRTSELSFALLHLFVNFFQLCLL